MNCRLHLESVANDESGCCGAASREYTDRKPSVNQLPEPSREGPNRLSVDPRLLSPAQREGIGVARELQQPRPSRWMERFQRVANDVALDDTARGHDGLGRAQAALPVLKVDERKYS